MRNSQHLSKNFPTPSIRSFDALRWEPEHPEIVPTAVVSQQSKKRDSSLPFTPFTRGNWRGYFHLEWNSQTGNLELFSVSPFASVQPAVGELHYVWDQSPGRSSFCEKKRNSDWIPSERKWKVQLGPIYDIEEHSLYTSFPLYLSKEGEVIPPTRKGSALYDRSKVGANEAWVFHLFGPVGVSLHLRENKVLYLVLESPFHVEQFVIQCKLNSSNKKALLPVLKSMEIADSSIVYGQEKKVVEVDAPDSSSVPTTPVFLRWFGQGERAERLKRCYLRLVPPVAKKQNSDARMNQSVRLYVSSKKSSWWDSVKQTFFPDFSSSTHPIEKTHRVMELNGATIEVSKENTNSFGILFSSHPNRGAKAQVNEKKAKPQMAEVTVRCACERALWLEWFKSCGATIVGETGISCSETIAQDTLVLNPKGGESSAAICNRDSSSLSTSCDEHLESKQVGIRGARQAHSVTSSSILQRSICHHHRAKTEKSRSTSVVSRNSSSHHRRSHSRGSVRVLRRKSSHQSPSGTKHSPNEAFSTQKHISPVASIQEAKRLPEQVAEQAKEPEPPLNVASTTTSKKVRAASQTATSPINRPPVKRDARKQITIFSPSLPTEEITLHHKSEVGKSQDISSSMGSRLRAYKWSLYLDDTTGSDTDSNDSLEKREDTMSPTRPCPLSKSEIEKEAASVPFVKEESKRRVREMPLQPTSSLYASCAQKHDVGSCANVESATVLEERSTGNDCSSVEPSSVLNESPPILDTATEKTSKLAVNESSPSIKKCLEETMLRGKSGSPCSSVNEMSKRLESSVDVSSSLTDFEENANKKQCHSMAFSSSVSLTEKALKSFVQYTAKAEKEGHSSAPQLKSIPQVTTPTLSHDKLQSSSSFYSAPHLSSSLSLLNYPSSPRNLVNENRYVLWSNILDALVT